MDQDDHSLFDSGTDNLPDFEKLFSTHYLSLCIYARRIVGDMDIARDLVQDVFVMVYEKRSTLKIRSAKSFLYRSVYHACLNHLKKINTHQRHHEYLKYTMPDSEYHDSVIQAELEEKIWKAVQKLPDQCRRIFEMNRFEGKKNKEIAEILGISIRTVETQISKALRMIRKDVEHLLIALMLLSSVIA